MIPMHNYYECRVKFDKLLENGTEKKVTEAYLVEATSFTEAENRIIAEMTPFISGVFEVSAVKKERISELFPDTSGDKWYRAKVMFVSLDEKTGLEKKAASIMLVQAKDFDTAFKNLKEGMKGTMSDWEINTIQETPILGLYSINNG